MCELPIGQELKFWNDLDEDIIHKKRKNPIHKPFNCFTNHRYEVISA